MSLVTEGGLHTCTSLVLPCGQWGCRLPEVSRKRVQESQVAYSTMLLTNISFLFVDFQDEKCSLQIHNRFSHSRMVSFAMGPLSVPNAVGIIIAHGHPGSALTRRADVWMTRDGGYNWKKVWISEIARLDQSPSAVQENGFALPPPLPPPPSRPPRTGPERVPGV